MFHNFLMTSLTALGETDEVNCWDNRPFTTKWPEIKQEKVKDTGIKKTIKKKNKRNRTMFTTEQLRLLETVYTRSKYIDVERRKEIASCLQIDQKCIKIWFQNRRMKEKKELSESCDSTNESVAESVSPPLEASQPKGELNNTYLSPYSHVRSPQYEYYHAQYSYYPSEAPRNAATSFVMPNNCASPVYTNLDTNRYNNYAGHTTHYYEPQNSFYNSYNTQYANNIYDGSSGQDWSIQNFGFNYQ